MSERPPTEGESLLFGLILMVSITVVLNFIVYVFTN